MANQSILAAFERMWLHVVNKVATIVSESKTYTDQETAKKSQVQIITWEADD